MISHLNYFSSDMSLSNPDIQNQMVTDQDEQEYEENKENFFNNQYSNQQQYSSINSSLRSSPVNLRRSSSIRSNNLNERIPLQDLTEAEEFVSSSLSNADYYIAQQENQFFQYRQQQKKSSQNQNNNKSYQTATKITRANLLR